MKKFRILFEGKNFLLKLDGKRDRFGFFCTRHIEAQNRLLAENEAVQRLENELSGNYENAVSDPPIIEINEICEVESFKGAAPSGFTFYPENEESD